jgi:hypothetical protein
MKRMKLFLVLTVIAALLLATMPASAETTRIDFTGFDSCDPDTLIFTRAWEAGPNLHIAGITQTCHDTASIPQLTGTTYLFDSRINLVGGESNFIIFGKFRTESDEGGVWVGSWVLPANTSTIQVVGHGEGLYEGQQLHWFLDVSGPFWGYILTPGN